MMPGFTATLPLVRDRHDRLVSLGAQGMTSRARISEATDKRTAAGQEILKARKRRDLQSLASPIDGTVTNLAALKVGGVVEPGDTLLNIVPLSATSEIEAMVLNKDAGVVLAGQMVTVKFDAFTPRPGGATTRTNRYGCVMIAAMAASIATTSLREAWAQADTMLELQLAARCQAKVFNNGTAKGDSLGDRRYRARSRGER